MKTYLVFEPAGSGRSAEAADRVRFVREKFVWSALLFAPVWLLWHGLWLGLVAWIAAVAGIGALATALALDPRIAALAYLIPSLVLAFEGTELRRRKLLRRGFRDAGVAVGEDLEDAERRFFAKWARPATAPAGSPASAPKAPPPDASAGFAPYAPDPVIGLFPEPGARR